MRISDWSSDVCSSDLGRWDLVKEQHTRSGAFVSVRTDITERKRAELALRDQESRLEQALAERTAQIKGILANIAQGVTVTAPDLTRSEEHTSELQSLMRISYAVFCLKKKHKHQLHNNTITQQH